VRPRLSAELLTECLLLALDDLEGFGVQLHHPAFARLRQALDFLAAHLDSLQNRIRFFPRRSWVLVNRTRLLGTPANGGVAAARAARRGFARIAVTPARRGHGQVGTSGTACSIGSGVCPSVPAPLYPPEYTCPRARAVRRGWARHRCGGQSTMPHSHGMTLSECPTNRELAGFVNAAVDRMYPHGPPWGAAPRDCRPLVSPTTVPTGWLFNARSNAPPPLRPVGRLNRRFSARLQSASAY
jgi:hypothetical protein